MSLNKSRTFETEYEKIPLLESTGGSKLFSEKVYKTFRLLIVLEVGLIFLSSLIVSAIRLNSNLWEVLFSFPGQPKIFILPILWYFMIYLNDGWDKSQILNSQKYYLNVMDSALKTLLTFSAFAFLINYPISRLWVFYNVLTITLVLLINRFVLRRQLLNNFSEDRDLNYIFVGEKRDWNVFKEEFKSLFGYVPRITFLDGPKNLQPEEWLSNYKKRVTSDTYGIIVGYTAINDAQLLKEISNYNRDKIIDFILVSRIAPLINRFEVLENPTLIRVKQSSFFASGMFLKRLLDVLGAILGLILLSPLMVLTAILVKITSQGPILFSDRRVGKNGEEFTFPKYRSMYYGSHLSREEFIGLPDDKISERYKADPRITPLGRFIRRWSIDELPQLWCVLIGTMSLVGPRPILVEEKDLVDPLHTDRFLAKPGLTGLWQVTGRKEVAWNDRMLRDLSYIENWSFFNDLIYILKTFKAIGDGKGAY